MDLTLRVRSVLAYQRARRTKTRQRDEQWGCGTPHYIDTIGEAGKQLRNADKPAPEWAHIRKADVGDRIYGGGVVLKDIPGAGRVYDWRDSNWTRSNGGKIYPLVFVQHIPVVPNITGIADFIRLRDVLVAQGLMVHSATDREGNVALYTPFNYLNYHARGANAVSCGCEHMHMSTGEPWTERQFRAAAWLVNLAKDKHGIPASNGELAGGRGTVKVVDRGQVSHERVSSAAGYNDRSDPGPKYDFGHVRELVIWWREHQSFLGAPD